MVEDGTSDRKNGFILAFGILIFVAILTVAAVFVVKSLEGEEKKEETVSEDEKKNQEIASLDEIKEHIRSVGSAEGEKYVNEQVEKYRGTDLEFDVKIIQINFYNNEGEMEKALELADAFKLEDLTAEEKMKLFIAYRTIYSNLGDNEKYDEYQKKYMEVYLEVFDGGGGGE